MTAIVLSFLLWEESLSNLINELIASTNSAALIALIIFCLLALDVALPIPSSVVSVAAALYFGFLGSVLLIFLGMSTCCVIAYYLGGSANKFFASRKLHGTRREQKIIDWTGRWGYWALCIARPVPVLAETSVVMAGMAKMPFHKFLAYTLSANLVIAISYGYLGSLTLAAI